MLRRRLKRSQEARTELWTFPMAGCAVPVSVGLGMSLTN